MFGIEFEHYELRTQLSEKENRVRYQVIEKQTRRECLIDLYTGLKIYSDADKKKLAQLTESLNPIHECFLPVVDFGVENQSPYFVYPWLSQTTLQNRLNNGPADWVDIARTFLSIGEALDAAASSGVIHCDLQPENIYFDPDGHPFIINVGVFQILEEMSGDRLMPFNPLYASPEQVRKQVLDGRIHVYALGALIYHALTGTPVFEGAEPKLILYKHISHAPQAPRELRPDLSPQVEKALLKALAKKSDERYANTLEFLNDIYIPKLPALPLEKKPDDGISMAPVFGEIDNIQLDEPMVSVSEPILKKKNSVLIWGIFIFFALIACNYLFSRFYSAYLQQNLLPISNRSSTNVYSTQIAVQSTATFMAKATSTAIAQTTAVANYFKSGSEWVAIFAESYDTNRNGWDIGQVKSEYWVGKRTISQGKYTWEMTANRGFLSRSTLATAATDFFLSVDVKEASDVIARGEYGLVFRHSRNGFYIFQIDNQNRYGVALYNRDQWILLIKPKKSAEIISGELNQLTVIAEGSRFLLFINGRYVDEFDDTTLADGEVGVFASLSQAGQTSTIEFDNFVLRVPSENLPTAAVTRVVPTRLPTYTPTISPTPEPTATLPPAFATPLAQNTGFASEVSQQWQSILQDDFETNEKKWLTNEELQIDGGMYRWDIDVIFSGQFIDAYQRVDGLSDLFLSVETAKIAGSPDVSYGLFYGKYEQTGYLFEIKENQTFRVSLIVPGSSTYQTIIEWTTTTSIRSGEINRLAVLVYGSRNILLINDQYVGEFLNENYLVFSVGMAVHPPLKEIVVLEFDNFELFAP